MRNEKIDPDRNRLGYGLIFATSIDSLRETVGRAPEGEDLFALLAGWEMVRVIKAWKKIKEGQPHWSEINGAKILDLGSGSLHSTSPRMTYFPHFTRFAAISGARVTAVDMFRQSHYDETLFRGLVADLVPLVMEGRLEDIPGLNGDKFDIVHSNNFVGGNPSDRLAARLAGNRIGFEDFEQRLVKESTKLLVEGGIIDHDQLVEGGNKIYRMTNGILIPEVV